MTSETNLFYEEERAENKAAAEALAKATKPYLVRVYYRTNSGCNAKDVTVEAATSEAAITLANDKVRRMRGVIRIDGGDWRTI